MIPKLMALARRRVSLGDRPSDTYRAPGYPIVQIMFVVIAAAVVLSVVWNDPSSALRGALLLAAGIPLFFWFRSRHLATRTAGENRL